MKKIRNKFNRRFDVSKALRSAQIRLPAKTRGLDTKEYIETVSRMNGHVPVEYIINGKKVTI